MRADAMLEKGAMAGAATWRRIVKAVEELQKTESGLRCEFIEAALIRRIPD